MKNKSILFITTHNLATNPRLVKEIYLALSLQFRIKVICFKFYNWSSENDIKILNDFLEKGVQLIQIETGKKNFKYWILSKVIKNGCVQFSKFLKSNLLINAYAINDRTWLINLHVNKLKEKFDWVIAHNPGAFYPAYRFAKAKNTRLGIDIEDYHPGEGNDRCIQQSIKFIMKSILNSSTYNSYASSLIKKYSEKILNIPIRKNDVIVNNLFSLLEFREPIEKCILQDKIRLVWFSQYIDYGRGLEIILPVLDKYSNEFHLTLIGSVRKDFDTTELKHRNYIEKLGTFTQYKLNQLLHTFDVGLAIENSFSDFNRNICLTNKIWAYFQSGVFIFASDTEAQKEFILENMESGIIISLNKESLEEGFKILIRDIKLIRSAKKVRYKLAQQNSWESESIKLANIWKT